MLHEEPGVLTASAREWSAAFGQKLSVLLLDWFNSPLRRMPWRQSKDPYRIWLSEIMLQQTQVQTVIPYYQRFLDNFPSLSDLAGASSEQVLKQWEGLGYYTRAQNLLAAAGLVQKNFQGQLPASEKELRRLPGIGEYTACAIISIAYGQKAAAVDGNVVRVFSRLTALPWKPADSVQRREIRQLLEMLMPDDRPGDFNEALMDLGATICLPHQPLCHKCPLADLCLARDQGTTAHFPARPAKKVIPVEKLTVMVYWREGCVLVRKRPAKGLLAGLYEFAWLNQEQSLAQDIPGAQIFPLGAYSHRFTHRQWNLEGYLIKLPDERPLAGISQPDALWVTLDELAALPFPTALDRYRRMVIENFNSSFSFSG